MEGTAVGWSSWHNAEQDAATRDQVIRAVYSVLTRRRKLLLHGELQQNKLPDFTRRLEESLYKMARSREEYADLSTLELRLQQVVAHLVRKPGTSGRGASQMSDGGGDSVAQQLAGGGGDAFTPNSHSRQQAQQAALYAAQQQHMQQQQQQHAQQQQQQQQQQMVPQGMMPVANGGLNWLDGGAGGAGGGGMGMVPQQQQGAQQQAPNGGGAGNQLAVAGAPAGQSTAESAQRGATGNSGGVDFSSLAAGGGDVTSGLSLPAGSALQQQGAAPPGGMQQAGGGMGRLGALNSNYMSMTNGAPVLLRGAGGGDGGGGMVPMGGLVPSANGMMPLGGGGSSLSMMPTSQAPLSGLGANSMLPTVKMEASGGAGMVPVGGGGGGMMPLGAGGGSMVPVGGGSAGGMMTQLPGLSQQQHGGLQPPAALGEQQGGMQHLGGAGAAGLVGTGGFTGMLMGGSNGYASSGLLPVGGGAQQAGLHQQHAQQQWGLQQVGGQPAGTAALLQQQQPVQHAPGAFGQPGAAAALPLMQQQQPQQQQGMAVAGMARLPGLDGLKQELQPALPSFSNDVDHSFNLLGNAFADVGGAMGGGGGDARKQQILKQQRWLLFLRHCARCQLPEGHCQYGRNCTVAKQLWQHLVNCKESNCGYPRCNPSRELLRHHQKCTSPNCPVCAPVKQYVSKQRQLVFHRKTATLTPELRHNLLLHLQQNPLARENFQAKHGVDVNTIFATLDPGAGASTASVGTSAGVAPGGAGMQAGVLPQQQQQQLPSAMQAQLMQQHQQHQQQHQPLPSMAAAMNATAGGAGALATPHMPGAAAATPPGGGVLPVGGGAGYGAAQGMQPPPPQQQLGMVPVGAAGGYGAVDANVLAAVPKRQRTRMAQENCGTSLLEFFSEQQIDTHVAKLRSKDPALMQVKGVPKQQPGLNPFHMQEMESNCKVCELNRLTFEPPSLYCFGCGQRIKRNQVYYGTPSNHEIKGVWCHPCYQDIKAETVPLDGFNIRKAELEKRKNDDEVEEGWVQCDQCEGWVHQICGLFNKGRNDQNRGFLCPFCLRDGLRTGERRAATERPQAMLTARDLPACDLSDHLERRLERVLREERMQRAAMEGRHPSEVRTAEGLTVRVVNNVVKRNDVRQRLYNLVKPEGYPEAFMYKQKVILLFQNIDGVDLCLYCMYMQEYGDNVPPPNRKSVYLSYLDSVKYFQPEDVVAAGRGVALRTMVYHEMLLGYLEYVKARGFESMFIWACPPLAGDDYIMYCHPGKQKTPRSDRLREWYLTMLSRAKEEGTVTYISNMWDTYFEGGRDHRLDRLSITQLPYYDGDYWPGEAENLLASISTEAQQGGKGGKPSIKTTSSSRSKPLKGKRVGAGSGSIADELLSRLGETIQGMREDFIVVHLQEPCSFCREYMSEGLRYYHPNPPQKVVVRSERTFDGISLDKPGSDATRTVTYTRFALCTKCYSAECAGHGKGLPPGMQIGELLPARNPRIPATVDTIQEMENEFFDTRTAFLSLCQGNHYQFDSLRRAKHSSMMVLYHLHNPTAPAFSCTCNVCNKEIQDPGWRCSTCPDFDMCNACFLNPAVPRHPHQLVRHARDIDERRNRLTQEQLSARNQSLHRTMQVLLHASECADPKCPSTSCARVKAMYHHAMTCPVKLAGNCQYCRRMWMLLQMHATHCTVPNCQVPRCTHLRVLRRRQATRQEDKRRAAYRTMLRQQTGG